MSASTEQTITVNAPRDVETIIIDHAFNLVHHGVGSLTHALAPGLYKFKYRRGLEIHDTLEEIGDAPRTIDAPEVEFSCSGPLSMSRGRFDPESEMLRMADAARIALQEKRTTMPRELLSELLDDNFANPMLGIYGGCALATQSPDALPRVLFALDRLVPGHPDVNALHLAVGESN